MLRRRQPKPRNRLPQANLGKLSELKLVIGLLLFFLHIAPYLLHKTQNGCWAVHAVLSQQPFFRYAQNLRHSLQKSRGARLVLYAK